MEKRFKPLFPSSCPNVLIPKFTDGPVKGYWNLKASGSPFGEIPLMETLVYADGTDPSTGRKRRDLWARRVAEEVAVFEEWVRRLEERGEHVPFRDLRPDPNNPRLFHCLYCPPGGGEPVPFRIKLSSRYPEVPPITDGLGKVISYGRYRKPGSGEPCLGPLGEKNWKRNWRRWGIAHFLGLIGYYESTRPEYAIRAGEGRGRRRR